MGNAQPIPLKIGVVGPQGSGKTTLIKKLISQPDNNQTRKVPEISRPSSMPFVITPAILPIRLSPKEKEIYLNLQSPSPNNSNSTTKNSSPAQTQSGWLFQSQPSLFSPPNISFTPPQETYPVKIDFYDYGGSVREMHSFRDLLEKPASQKQQNSQTLESFEEDKDFDLVIFCLDANDEELNAYATRKLRNELNTNTTNNPRDNYNNLASVADITNKVLDDFKLGAASEISTLANYLDLHPINESALSWFSSCFYSNNVYLNVKKTPLMILSNHKLSQNSSSSMGGDTGIELDQLYEAFSLDKLEKNEILFLIHDTDMEGDIIPVFHTVEWAIKNFVFLK